MREQWFEVELLDNVVVSADSATEGGHRCLDYLPGSVFLGVAAAKLFKKFGAETFLSGHLRFSPALPITIDKKLTFPMPLSFHAHKGFDFSRSVPVRNGLSFDWAGQSSQLVQIRQGTATKKGQVFEVAKGRDMKSATDRDRFGSPRENHLFGYESIEKGQRFALRVQADDEALTAEQFNEVIAVLTVEDGIFLGRSRSAEYGRGKITIANTRFELPQPPVESNEDDDETVTAPILPANLCVFYLLSDVALYRNGCPTLRPLSEDFGLPAGLPLLSERSFLRTRRYSPWNTFHRCLEMERQVILRGSVISFQLGKKLASAELAAIEAWLDPGVGAFRQDGLGWVLVNPAFVLSPPATLSKSSPTHPVVHEPTINDNHLISLVSRKRDFEKVQDDSLGYGQAWADEWWTFHNRLKQADKQPPGKSQWGGIRNFTIKAGGDLNSLKTLIIEFCSHAERKRWWCAELKSGGVSSSMAAKVKEKLEVQLLVKDPLLHEALLIRAIHHAAAEMARRFDSILTKEDRP